MNFKNKITEFQKVLNTAFPGLQTATTSFGNIIDDDEVWHQFHFGIPNENSNLEKSKYFFGHKSFVHFTKTQYLTSILEAKALRLYNLHHLNDPREFTFASSVFRADEKITDDARENLFTLSACDTALIKEGKSAAEFNLWRLYGDSGKGVGIVFSIENDPSLWVDFHLSKVIYGSSKRMRFRKLLDSIERLNKSNPIVTVDLGKIMAFHKSLLFKHEEEIRLLFDRRKVRSGYQGRTYLSNMNEVIFPIIKKSETDDSRYLQLPIYWEGYNDDATVPILKIKEILIGFNYKREELKTIIDGVRKSCKEQIGYSPVVRQTRLAKYYWGTEN